MIWMKNKGILFVMAGIVSVGVLVTAYTDFYVKSQAGASVPQTMMAEAAQSDVTVPDTMAAAPEGAPAAPEAAPRAMAAGLEETMAGARAASEETAPGDSAEAASLDGAETESGSETVITPLDPPGPGSSMEKSVRIEQGGAGSSTLIVEKNALTDYQARLAELDSQIQKIREEGTESTTYSMKAAAENELKLWDSELNAVYNDILKRMSTEEAEKLVTEEREWMKKRDAMAVEAAKKSAGGTLEGLEYTASLALSTRERAYQLADLYVQVTE